MQLIQQIHHMGIKCGSMEEFQEAVAFYRDVLGMRPVRSWGEGVDAGLMLSCGGNNLFELCASGKTSGISGALNHIALAVDDVEACAAAVKAAGYPITLGPTDVTMKAEQPYPVCVAFCIGPVGEEVEFFKEY